MVRGNSQLPIFVTGRINRDTLETVFSLQPDGIIISRPITDADNPAEEAQYFYEKINEPSKG